jgi:hypothetical protein
MMKLITVGTPTHECKEYAIYRWLDSMFSIIIPLDYHINFIIVDNSDTEDFSIRMKEHIRKIGFDDVWVYWLPGMVNKEDEERRRDSREFIRNRILGLTTDIWLSWECDILVESSTLQLLVSYLSTFDVVDIMYPSRDGTEEMWGGIGFMLVRRELLERFSFLDGGGYAYCNPKRLTCYYSGDSWFMTRVVLAGFKQSTFTNLVKVSHLGE